MRALVYRSWEAILLAILVVFTLMKIRVGN